MSRIAFSLRILPLVVFAASAAGQEIRLFSEFERFDPFGNVLPVDRDMQPREVLSPAVPRNGHLSYHVVVSGPTNTNYFLYVMSNPPDILELKLYREHWRRCGEWICADWITPLKSPAFGAIPESLTDNQGQTTRNYLLDIYVPPGVPPRRVRVEALLKVGIWLIAPLEVRVIAPMVPASGREPEELLAPVEAPSSRTAELQLLRFLDGQAPTTPPRLLRVRDVIQRNAAEDMSLAAAYGKPVPEFTWMAFWPFTFPELGSEWYLRVRDFVYRLEQ